MKVIHNHKGAILPFIVTAGIVTSSVAIVMAYLLMLIGGSRQGTNANDAGNLNVAKCAPLIKVYSDSIIFASVSDRGSFSLRNINRLWGHAMLTNLNQRSMQLTGTATSASAANATMEWNLAQSISSNLSQKLNDRANLEPYFRHVATNNNLGKLSPINQLQPTGEWRTSLMNRGTESNLRIFNHQLPPGVTLASLGNPVIKMPDNHLYLKGYMPIPAVSDRFINFVPFEYEGAPHAVSIKRFDQNTLQSRPYPLWNNPVPNTFESKSNVPDSGLRNHVFDAVAIANTKDRWNLEIPNGFVRFKLGQDKVNWFAYHMPGTPPHTMLHKIRNVYTAHIVDVILPLSWFEPHLDYGEQYYEPGTQVRTLYRAIYAMNDHNDAIYAQFNQLLLNRANQIKPGTSWASIVALLKSEQITGPGTGNAFILGRDRQNNLMIADMQNPAEVSQLSSFIDTTAQPDGKVFQVSKDDANAPVKPKLLWVDHWMTTPLGIYKKPIPGTTKWIHKLDITPGTGVNGALLEVAQSGEVDAAWDGLPNPHPSP